MSVEIKGSGSVARGSAAGTISRSAGRSERSSSSSSYKPMFSISKEGSISRIGAIQSSGKETPKNAKWAPLRVEGSRFSRDTAVPSENLRSLKVEARSPFVTAMQSRAEAKTQPRTEVLKIKVNNSTTRPYEWGGLPSFDKKIYASPKAQSIFLYQRQPEGAKVTSLPKITESVHQRRQEVKKPSLPQLRADVLPSSDRQISVPRRSETAFLYQRAKTESVQPTIIEQKKNEITPELKTLDVRPQNRVPTESKPEVLRQMAKKTDKQPLAVNRKARSDWEAKQAVYLAKKLASTSSLASAEGQSKIKSTREGKAVPSSMFAQKLTDKAKQQPLTIPRRVEPLLIPVKDLRNLEQRVNKLRLQVVPNAGERVVTKLDSVNHAENSTHLLPTSYAENRTGITLTPEQAKIELQTKLRDGVIVVRRMTEVMVSRGVDFSSAQETALSRVTVSVAQVVHSRQLDMFLAPQSELLSRAEKTQTLKTYEKPLLIQFQRPGTDIRMMTGQHQRRMIATMAQTMPAEHIYQELKKYQAEPLSVEAIEEVITVEQPIASLIGSKPEAMIKELSINNPEVFQEELRPNVLVDQLLNEEEEGVTKRLVFDENEGYVIECERIVTERDTEADANRIRTAVQVGVEALTEANKTGQAIISSRYVAMRMPSQPGSALVSFIRKQLELMLDSEAQYDAFNEALGNYGYVGSATEIEMAAKYATDQAPAVRLTKVVTTERVKPIDEERAISSGQRQIQRAA